MPSLERTVPIVLQAVRCVQPAGRPASGATSAIAQIRRCARDRVPGPVFSVPGGYATPSALVDGSVPALTIRAITVAIGAAAALLSQPLRRTTATSLNWQPRPSHDRHAKTSTADPSGGKVL